MQRNVGPGALLRLIWGALRLDPETYRGAVTDAALTRIHLAIVVLAAISNGFAYASQGVSSGRVGEREVALYRLLVIAGVIEILVQFVAFVVAVYLIRRITRRPPMPFGTLARLLALGLAPSCLLVFGPLIGFPDETRGVLAIWRIVASVFALRIALDASWIGSIATVLGADLIASPLVSLLLFGAGERSMPGLPS